MVLWEIIHGANDKCNISYCYNTSKITGEVNVGGIAGGSSNKGNISYSYNLGEIIGNSKNSSGDSFISIAENQIKIWRSPNWDCVKTITDTSNIVGTWFNGEIIKSVSEKQIHKWHVPTFDNLFNDAIERFKERPLTLEERKQYYLE